ncbi:homoserine O-acetyltransferase MetX [Timonella senegalensis]|uniref:homoserine O-acetyltransferase MetX n=1 Tax=Timonella senegalensis TaxID=1465825 RepID=UPI0009D95C53|nr:homoserine O-acetyltransferase [Timonella senegalensis]
MSSQSPVPAQEWTRHSAPVRPGSQRATNLPTSGAARQNAQGPNPALSVVEIGDVDLEAGGILPNVHVAYETWGTLNENRDNAVLILHALTGDSHVTRSLTERAADSPAGWWEDMVGPGAPIDTDRFFVVAPNVLGGCQGTTGPSEPAPDGLPWGSQFPVITVRDQVSAEIAFTKELGIASWKFIAGASMGGLRVLEWSLMGPEQGIGVESTAVIASSAQATGDQIAWAHPQIAAIESDRFFNGGDYYDNPQGEGPTVGLGIARQIAHTTYRSAKELDQRFGRIPQHAEDPMFGGRFAVQSYLDHHADKLARRFDANSYIVLTQAMLTHDLGRDRGGVATALRTITTPTLVVAVDSDRLFLPRESHRIVAHIPSAVPLEVISSDYGHDGFLIEFDQLGPIVAKFLRQHSKKN